MTNPQPTPEQKARGTAMVVNIVRGTGAVLMLAGTAVALNIGGVATLIGLSDDIQKIVGGGIAFAGLIDFFVLPSIIAKANK
jgi:Na+/H+ antiporter NhaD/arsenite permease-like protein